MATLYNINSDLLQVIENGFCLDAETGEVTNYEPEALDALNCEREAKLEGCALLVKSLEADAKAIKEEEAALKARRSAKERKADYLKRYIAQSMQLFGDSKLETPRAALSFRKSSTVEVLDAAALPAEYMTVKTTSAPNKTAIKAAIKAGEEVAGAALVERQNLQIK